MKGTIRDIMYNAALNGTVHFIKGYLEGLEIQDEAGELYESGKKAYELGDIFFERLKTRENHPEHDFVEDGLITLLRMNGLLKKGRNAVAEIKVKLDRKRNPDQRQTTTASESVFPVKAVKENTDYIPGDATIDTVVGEITAPAQAETYKAGQAYPSGATQQAKPEQYAPPIKPTAKAYAPQTQQQTTEIAQPSAPKIDPLDERVKRTLAELEESTRKLGRTSAYRAKEPQTPQEIKISPPTPTAQAAKPVTEPEPAKRVEYTPDPAAQKEMPQTADRVETEQQRTYTASQSAAKQHSAEEKKTKRKKIAHEKTYTPRSANPDLDKRIDDYLLGKTTEHPFRQERKENYARDTYEKGQEYLDLVLRNFDNNYLREARMAGRLHEIGYTAPEILQTGKTYGFSRLTDQASLSDMLIAHDIMSGKFRAQTGKPKKTRKKKRLDEELLS